MAVTTEVSIRQGVVRGVVVDGVSTFKGIPYAMAPVGDLRFAPPQPVPPSAAMIDAAEFGATVSTPPQRSPEIDRLLPDPVRPGPDPLNLNIWTPDPAAALPVMVWVHGGGFVTGAGSIEAYDGAAFARDGIVVVTFNYRLAVEGFLAVIGAVPNRGLLDQIAALEWVRDNITAFGGDPGQVTLAGESAGAMSVVTLLSMPRARGLFRRAIAQSGAGHHVHTVDEAAFVAELLGQELGIVPTPAALGSVSDARLYEAFNAVLGQATSSEDPRGRTIRRLGVQPVVDGEILPALPADAISRRAGSDVDLLIGTNGDEYGLFVEATGLAERFDEGMLRQIVSRLGDEVAAMIPAYRTDAPGSSPAELYKAIQSDWFFQVPMLRVLEGRESASASTYAYQMLWNPPTFGGRLGACHTLDVPFVFDTLDVSWGRELRGDEPPQSLADEMHGSWVSFIRTGNPGWPTYAPGCMVNQFNVVSALAADPHAVRRDRWMDLLR